MLEDGIIQRERSGVECPFEENEWDARLVSTCRADVVGSEEGFKAENDSNLLLLERLSLASIEF